MKKKYQIFVSSTYRDLIEERTAVMDTLLKADCIPTGMELFPASDDTQWKVIQQVIDESDYYVVVIAGKYGSEYKGKSFTQREYEYAVSKKKRVLALLHKRPDSLLVSKCEKSESKQKKLAAFRLLAQKRLCDFWTNKEDLSAALYHAITSLKSRYPQDGWVRATQYNLKKLSEKRNKNLIKENSNLKGALNKIKTKITEEKQNDSPVSSESDIKKILHQKIETINKSINSLFPEKVCSPRYPDNKLFSSQLLINSLSSMGIPLDVSLDVLESSVPEIIGLKRQISQLETSHIRKAIANALYKLDQDIYSEDQIQAWGDSYVRRYGNPHIRPLVLIDDDEKHHHEIIPLTYKFVKRVLVPDLLKGIVGKKSFIHLIKSCRKKEDARIADVIIRSIRSLDINRIHYSTLLALATDLALQPPHPWLVPRAFDFDSILYDYERASHHALNVRSIIENGELHAGKYPLRECIHHSCSGILATYGVFMGCGYLAPFYNFTYQVGQIIEGRTQEVFQYSKLENLRHDLFTFGIDMKQLYDSLTKFRNEVNWNNPLKHPNIEELCEQTLQLFKIFHYIFSVYYSDNLPDFGNKLQELLSGRPSQSAPPTPRSIRVRTARFG